MSAGESAHQRARSLRQREAALRAEAARLAELATKHEKGAAGERRLADLLTPLGADGYRRFDDLGVPGRRINIDHVLVGPGGVFVVDAKNWSGTLGTSGAELTHNGRRRPAVIDDALEQRDVVARVVADVGLGDAAPIWPVVMFVGDATMGSPRLFRHVHVLDGPDAVPYIRRFRRVFDDRIVGLVADAIGRGMAPRSSPTEHGGDTGVALPPNEDIVFVTPWNNYGKRRLYVKDELGVDGGYLDLVKGTVEASSPFANAVLRHMVPTYANDPRSDATDADRTSIVRFLDWMHTQPLWANPSPLVVGMPWRRRGIHRLYVHYLHANGAKSDLGWAELLGVPRVHADLEGWESVIRYCRDRFEAIEARRRGGSG